MGCRKATPRGVWEIMDSLRDISPDDLFPGVAYSISEDDDDEDMPYTRPVRPMQRKDGRKSGQGSRQSGSSQNGSSSILDGRGGGSGDRKKPEGNVAAAVAVATQGCSAHLPWGGHLCLPTCSAPPLQLVHRTAVMMTCLELGRLLNS